MSQKLECRFVFSLPQLSGRDNKRNFTSFYLYLFPQDFSDKFCFASARDGARLVTGYCTDSLYLFADYVRDDFSYFFTARARHHFG